MKKQKTILFLLQIGENWILTREVYTCHFLDKEEESAGIEILKNTIQAIVCKVVLGKATPKKIEKSYLKTRKQKKHAYENKYVLSLSSNNT